MPVTHADELIFIGTMGYLPNRDAARFMEQIRDVVGGFEARFKG